MERFRIPMDEYRHEGMHAFRRRSKAQLRDVLPEETGTVIAVLIGLAAVGLVLLLGSGLMGRIVYGLTPSAGAETYYVTADELNARFQPSRRAKVEALLKQGEAVEVLYIEGRWAACQIGADVLYCSVDYLTADEPTDGSSTAATIQSNGRVALRDAPSPDAQRVGWLHNGDKVAVSGVVDGWCRVTGGYVMEQFVMTAKEEDDQ